MRTVIKISCLLAISVGLASGQNNTIFQVLFSGLATGVPVTSANARAIGQQYHRIDVFASTVAPGTCTPTSGIVFLEGSSNGIDYVSITPPVTMLNAYAGVTYGFHNSTSVSGAYAYVRARYAATFGTACAITVNYSGSVTGTLTGSQPFAATNDTFSYVTGNYANSAAPSTIASCSGSLTLQVYSVMFTDPGGVNAPSLAVSNGSVIAWTMKFPLPANGQFILPQGSRPYFFSGPLAGTSILVLNVSANTEVDYTIAYRCE